MKHQATTKGAYRLLHDGILAFARAERQGMRIDVEYCKRKTKHLERKIAFLEEELKETKFYKHWVHSVGGKRVNINSNAQLARYLYQVKKLEPAKSTTTGQGSTDEEALTALNIPEINNLLQIRKLKKIKDTYLGAFIREQIDGMIHPFFNLNTVTTFRSSSDKPNFQNIPKRDKESMKLCRRAILPRKGYQLLEVDYSGIEVRISQCYHHDPTMKKYIEDPTTDMHGDMASQIYRIDNFDRHIPEHKYLRDAAKSSFVFPQFYGDYYVHCALYLASEWGKLPQEGTWKKGQGVPMPGGITLSDHLISKGLKSYKAFEKHIQAVENDFWNNRFKRYQQWKEQCWKQYQETGYIDMLTGFRCGDVIRRNEAINRPIQGSAFHCLLWSFIRLDQIMREEKWNTRLVGQIHDSILFDADPEELDRIIPIIHRVMCDDIREAWKWLIVPLEVEMDICAVDTPWSEKKEYGKGVN